MSYYPSGFVIDDGYKKDFKYVSDATSGSISVPKNGGTLAFSVSGMKGIIGIWLKFKWSGTYYKGWAIMDNGTINETIDTYGKTKTDGLYISSVSGNTINFLNKSKSYAATSLEYYIIGY